MAEIHRADPGARKLAVGCIVAISILGATTLLLFEQHRDSLAAWLLKDHSPFNAKLTAVFLVLVVGLAPLLAVASWTLAFGARVIRGNRHPPVDTKVIRDTPVVRGAAARVRGRVYQVLAALVLLAAVSSFWVLWKLWVPLVTRVSLPALRVYEDHAHCSANKHLELTVASELAISLPHRGSAAAQARRWAAYTRSAR